MQVDTISPSIAAAVTRPETIARALLGHAAVEDAAVLERRTDAGQSELVAYVVASGPFVPDRLHAHLRESCGDGPLPGAYVPVAALPLTDDGGIDRDALCALPVCDSDLIAAWESALGDSGVTVQEFAPRPTPYHLRDLLPAEALLRAGAESAPVAESAPSGPPRTAPERPMAYSDGGPLTIPDGAPATFTEAIQRTAATYPDRGVTYVRSDGSELFQSYPELLHSARTILTGLRERGLKPGDRVVLQVEALQDHFASFWACVLGGITPVTVAVAPSYAEANGVVNKLYNTWKLLEKPTVLTSDSLVDAIGGLTDLMGMDGLKVLSVDSLKGCAPADELYPATPEDLVFFQLTSGSTGVPKCIQERHSAIIRHIHGTQQYNGLTPENISFNWLPVDHVVPILTVHLKDVYLGCSQIHAKPDVVLSNPLRWLDLLEKHRVTHTWAPNFGFKLVADHLREHSGKSWDLTSVQFFMNAGEQVTLPVVREFLERTAPYGVVPNAMQPAFGMAEACTCMTYCNDFTVDTRVHRFLKSSLAGDLIEAEPGDTAVADFIDLGPPMPGIEIRITDPQNRPVKEGVIGRFQIRGGVITPGYLNNDAANRDAFVGDDWFNTGDIGFILGGSLTLTGREKEMIIVRGANFYCYEIEDVVNAIPGCEPTFTGASAVEDPVNGTEGLAIFFVPKSQDIAEQVQLIRAIKTKVTANLGITPAYVVPLPRKEFPKTTSGKIQRTQMKKNLLGGVYDPILKALDIAQGNANTLPSWFYAPTWRRKDAGPALPIPAAGATVVFHDGAGLAERVAESLAPDADRVDVYAGDAFARVSESRFTVDPASADDLSALLETLNAEGRPATRLLHLWTYRPGADLPTDAGALESAQTRGLYSVVHLLQALARHQGPEHPVQLLIASAHAQPTSPDAPVAWDIAPLVGVVKTVSQEMPYIDCRHVDLDGASGAEDAACLLRELAGHGDREVAYRDGQRLIARLERIDLSRSETRALPLRRGGLYLITGGLGGIALELGRYLLQRFDARLLLVGRTRRDDALAALEALGDVRFAAADVADADALSAAVEDAEAAWGCRLDGVFHLAGLYRDRLLVEETAQSLSDALRPKLAGALALHQLLESRPDALLVAFSSTTSHFGGALFGAYAAGNRFLDHLCHARRRQGLPTFNLGWSTWDELGMSRTVEGKDPLRATGRGFLALTAEQGIHSLAAVLAHGCPQALVGLDEGNANIRRQLDGGSPRTQQLCAFVTGPVAGAPSSVADRFGTPSAATVIPIDALPRTASGELDRAALADLGRQALHGGAERVAPRNDAERRVAQVWQDVLGVPQLGVHDNFFELGGHSLLATLVVSRLSDGAGQEIPVRLLFEAPTIAGLTEKLAALETTPGAQVPPLTPAGRGIALPLSFAQQRIWFVEQLEPGSPAHNLSIATRLTGALDPQALDRALTEIFRRHESLRTTFPAVGGTPSLHIAEPEPVSAPLVDLSGLPEGEREAEALRIAAADLRTPFDLAQGPLIRLQLVRIAPDDHALLVNVHHIVADGWSLGIFNQELSALYAAFVAGNESPLAPLPVQYADYALWQRRWLQGDVLEKQLAYWKEQIAGVPTLLELPLDHPRPPVQTFRGAHQSFTLDRALTDRLKALAQREGATLFMVLMAAFQALLARYSGQEQFLVSTGVGNRRAETEGLIGCLINILLLKADLGGDPSFRELLARVKETSIGAYANQDLPFEKLVEEIQPERDLSYNPLTQVMLVVLNAPVEGLSLPGIQTRRLDIETDAAQYDLTVHLYETADGMSGYLDYYTDLFEPETIARILGHFETLLGEIAADPTQPVARIPLLTAGERRQLLEGFNGTAVDLGAPKCLHHHIEAQAAARPDAPAVHFGDETLSYAQLNARANRLARRLRALGVGPDVLVGLSVARSLEMAVGMVAILKAGGAYVPLDPDYPQERLAFMLDDTRAPVLLTQAHLAPRFPAVAQIVVIDSAADEADGLSGDNLDVDVTPENLSYVIYTSGSTGQPKGISIRHAGVGNNLLDLNTRFGVGAGDSVLALSSLSFDMCVYEVLGMLCAGAAIVMPPQSHLREPLEWAKLIQRHRVTLWNSAPALLKMLVDLVEERPELWPATLRLALMGGDWVPVTLPDRLKAMAPGLRFIVMGGATEASIHSTIYEVERTDPNWRSIPYGHPMANQSAFVLDENQQMTPLGVAGELHLGGVGLGRGYWERPELTAQKFIPHPFIPGERLYKTGDLARWRPDGELELLGRIDYMVKLRGLRIELGEIEALLRKHPSVREAVVAAKGPDADKRLVAYVVAHEQSAGSLARLMHYESSGQLAGRKHKTLPNGMPVVFRNANEVDFGYSEIFDAQGYLQNGVTLDDDAVVFDIGANIGLFSLFVGSRCHGATIHAFEPIPDIYETLRLNAGLNDLNITLHHYGIADSERTETFTYFPNLSLISGRHADAAAQRETVRAFLANEHQVDLNDPLLDELLDERIRGEQVNCRLRRLSDVIAETGVERIDLLKIDVEKAELEVLAGIDDAHWGLIQQAVLEVYNADGRLDTIVDLLRGHGFEVAVEQDPMLAGTPFHNVFAFRPNRPRKAAAAPAPAPNRGWADADAMAADLKAWLKSGLPEYMVPSAFVLLERMPLSPNGKVDRKALPTPELADADARTDFVAPRTPTEEILAGIWASVLNGATVGATDHFFEVGGHSLLATQVISRIREAFQTDLPVRTLFEAPVLSQLAEAVDAARAAGDGVVAPPLTAAPRGANPPVSFAQQRLWIVDQLSSGGNASYNIPVAALLDGPLDADALQRSLDALVERHEILRTTFAMENRNPVQVIAPAGRLPLEIVDLTDLPEGERQDEAQRRAADELKTPFKLATGPLVRARLYRLDSQKHLLFFVSHHIVSDGWSISVFNRELAALYGAFSAGKESPLAPLPVQYADYALWQRAWLQGEVLEKEMGYWREQLAGAPTHLDLPTDRPRPPVQSFRGARLNFSLPEPLADEVHAFCQAQGATLYMTLLAAFKALLGRYSGTDDIVVGSPTAGRTRVETEGLLGFFINTLVLRTRLDGAPNFHQLLRRVREVVLGATAHQEVQFDRIVEMLRPPRDRSRNPVFQVNFRVQTAPPAPLELPGTDARPLEVLEFATSKFDLALDLTAVNGLHGYIEYNTDLFDPDTIVRVREDFEALLQALIRQPETPITALNLPHAPLKGN